MTDQPSTRNVRCQLDENSEVININLGDGEVFSVNYKEAVMIKRQLAELVFTWTREEVR